MYLRKLSICKNALVNACYIILNPKNLFWFCLFFYITTPPVIRVREQRFFDISSSWHLIKAEGFSIHRLLATHLLLEFHFMCQLFTHVFSAWRKFRFMSLIIGALYRRHGSIGWRSLTREEKGHRRENVPKQISPTFSTS